MDQNREAGVSAPFRSGFVTLVGRPNAGKSTLVNAAVGTKVAITSDTAQTTRHRLRAIVDRPGLQLVVVDTPGLHKPHDALGEELNHSTAKALEEVDVVAMVVDATKPVGRGDAWVADLVRASRAAKVLVITKADIADQAMVEGQIAKASELVGFDDVVVISAKEGFNVEGFIATVGAHLPEGPRWFPEGMHTDQALETIVAELIREKVLRTTHDEVPHSVGVQVEDLHYDEERDLYTIYAVIYCERNSQKGIIIGHAGAKIAEIGTAAREDLMRVLGCSVRLDLNVKVKQDWRRDASQIKRFGYGEGL